MLFRLVLFAAFLALAPQARAQDCAPEGGMGFICGAQRPEDLVRIPETRWIVASGFQDGAGLKLVDTQAKTMSFWFVDAKAQSKANRRAYPHCPGPLSVETFNAQGLSLRPRGAGYMLYVANHGGRESIEVFNVDLAGEAPPKLTWIGCVLMPDGYPANSVVSFADGELLASNLLRPGATIADYTEKRVTGGVYSWKPGQERFRLLPGTELPGNNGIERSLDEKSFYIVSFGLKQVLEFSRADTRKPLRVADAPGIMPDNIRWDSGKLIVAGLMADEPACGGLRKVVNGVADPMICHRGYVAAALDPETFTFSILAYGEPNARFNGTSTAIIVGKEMWFGSWQADRIAWRMLPGEN